MSHFTAPFQRYRYDFFLVWGHGFDCLEQIINIIRSEQNIEIMSIESHHISRMKKFVFELYGCDSVPVHHLQEKLRYLFTVKPQIIVIFVKNLAPEEDFVGEGPFRKPQCQYINRLKWNIRELYNPRVNDKRSEHHVIHASDYEEQVDYVLKLLGHKKGIFHLHKVSALPFQIPHHIGEPQSYVIGTLPIEKLRASILHQGHDGRVTKKLARIDETPHYKSLFGERDTYTAYLNRFRFTYLSDNHSWERFMQVVQRASNGPLCLPPIVVVPQGEFFEIFDGVHRAAALLAKNHESIVCLQIHD